MTTRAFFSKLAAVVAAHRYSLFRLTLYFVAAISLFSERKILFITILLAIILISIWELFGSAIKKMTVIVAAFIGERKEKIRNAGLAYGVDWAVNWLFNYPLYGYVMWRFGLQKGFLIMAFLSFLVCWIYIIIYDIIKKDLFLIEDVKDYVEKVASYNGKWKALRILALVVKRGGKITAFFLLSFFKDPFYATAYCRNGKFNGLKGKDWLIFLASVVVSNVPWALTIFGGVKGIEFLVG